MTCADVISFPLAVALLCYSLSSPRFFFIPLCTIGTASHACIIYAAWCLMRHGIPCGMVSPHGMASHGAWHL